MMYMLTLWITSNPQCAQRHNSEPCGPSLNGKTRSTSTQKLNRCENSSNNWWLAQTWAVSLQRRLWKETVSSWAQTYTHEVFLVWFYPLNFYKHANRRNLGEDALANLSIEKEGEDGPVTGFVRIRSRSQGLALSLGSLKGLNKVGEVAWWRAGPVLSLVIWFLRNGRIDKSASWDRGLLPNEYHGSWNAWAEVIVTTYCWSGSSRVEGRLPADRHEWRRKAKRSYLRLDQEWHTANEFFGSPDMIVDLTALFLLSVPCMRNTRRYRIRYPAVACDTVMDSRCFAFHPFPTKFLRSSKDSRWLKRISDRSNGSLKSYGGIL